MERRWGEENVPFMRLCFIDANCNVFLHAFPGAALPVLDGGVVHWACEGEVQFGGAA